MRKKLVPATIAGVLLALLAVACKNSVSNPPFFIFPEEAETPSITLVSEDASILLGNSVTIFVQASADDSGTLGYQWFSTDGSAITAIDGATEAACSVTIAKAGVYRFFCRVTNTLGESSRTADSATITVTATEPEITPPLPMRILTDSRGIALGFTADNAVQHQWYECADADGNNGMPIEGATNPFFFTGPYSQPGIHYYYCSVRTQSGMSASPVMTVAYTGLPTLYLDLDRPLASVTKDDYTLGKMRIVQPDGTEFEYEFTKSGTEGIKGRGNSSWSNFDKKGYNIKLDKKQGLFGLPKAKKWCIVANHSDKTLLRNKFASVLGNDVLGEAGGEWNPRFVSVDVVVNGEYRGNYLFGERITLTEGRVDVPDITETADLADGGFILEVDSRLDAEFTFKTDLKTVPFTLKDPDEVGADVQAHIMRIVNTAEAALYGDNFADTADGWRKYLDEASFIDWFIVNEFAKNVDAASFASIYMYYDPADGKLHRGPNWDFDIGFGNVNYNGCDDPTGWHIKNGSWIARLFEDETFVANLKKRWNEVKPAISMKSSTELRALAAANSVSAELNFARWQILGKYVWPNPAGYERRTTYQSEVDWMADWLERRYDWLDSAIEGL